MAPPPRLLLTTDVAAEGLDFRRVERVVHYDLPHTSMRLDQREGRAIRLGTEHPAVEVVRFLPPPPLERRLGRLRALTRKARLPAIAGLGPNGRDMWRWRAEIATRYEKGPRVHGLARVSAGPAGILAGYTVNGTAATLVWLDLATDECTDEPAVVCERLARAAESTEARDVGAAELHGALTALAGAIRGRVARFAGRRWSIPEPGIAARALAVRLQPHIAAAARCRDIATLRRFDQALHFLAGGHTAGEEILIARIAARPDGELAAALGRCPQRPKVATGLEVQLLGVVLFVPDPPPSATGLTR